MQRRKPLHQLLSQLQGGGSHGAVSAQYRKEHIVLEQLPGIPAWGVRQKGPGDPMDIRLRRRPPSVPLWHRAAEPQSQHRKPIGPEADAKLSEQLRQGLHLPCSALQQPLKQGVPYRLLDKSCLLIHIQRPFPLDSISV